jgi:hypothetical protein
MATDLKAWSTLDAENIDLSEGGFPENMDKSSVNDSGRIVAGTVRRWFEDPEWTDLLKEPGGGWTVTKLNDTTIRVTHDDTPTDGEYKFPVGSRIRVTETGTPVSVMGTIASATYSAPNTDVVVTVDAAAIIPAGANRAELFFARSVKDTAFHELGTDPTDVPTVADLGDGALLDQGHGNGFDADTVDSLHAADVEGNAQKRVNKLINGGPRVWQRGASIDSTSWFGNDNDSYCADQWLFLHEAGSVDVVKIVQETTDVPANVYSAMKLEATSPTGSPSAEKFGVAQILENEATVGLQGENVSLSFWAKATGGLQGVTNALRCMVLGWEGAADAVTSDFVSSWNVQGSDPTLAASWTQQGSTATFTTTGTWTRVSLENVPVAANVKNLAVFIWSEDKSYVATDTLLIAGMMLEESATAGPFREIPITQELAACQRFFHKTFQQGVAPAQNSGSQLGCATYRIALGGNEAEGVQVRFPTPMFSTPAIVTYNPNAANANWWNDDENASRGVPIITNVGDSGMGLWETAAAGNDNPQIMIIHYTAEAVL